MKKRIPFFLFQAFIFLAAPFAFAKDSATIAADANRLYKAGKYDAALKLYDEVLISNPDSPILHFNIGAAHFKKGDYEKAVSSFEKAALSGNTQLEAKANYNIGNAKYKLGKRKENTNLSATVKLLGEALDYYKRAIEVNPAPRSKERGFTGGGVNNKSKDAKINYELVERELKALSDKLKQQAHKKEQKAENRGQEKEEEEKEYQAEEKQGQKEEEKAQEEKALPESEQASHPQPAQGEAVLEPQETKEMSPEEARMLLEGYRQEEDAKGQIKYIRQGRLGEVDKDW